MLIKIEFWGSSKEFEALEKKHEELMQYLIYMGEDKPLNPVVLETMRRLEQDIEDMKKMKDLFVVNIMDRFIDKM